MHPTSANPRAAMETVAAQELSVNGEQQRHQQQQQQQQQNHGYRGRVRSGCLTCRSRKVRCDECRPICNNCSRLKRRCVYKPRKGDQQPGNTNTGSISLGEPVSLSAAGPSRDADAIPQPFPSPLSEEQPHDGFTPHTPRPDDAASSTSSWGPAEDPFLSPDSPIVDVAERLERALRLRHQHAMSVITTDGDGDDARFGTASTSDLISRDIELTTTIDLLAAREVPLQPSFSFFLQAVDSPCITPYDGVNWRRMKLEVVELGMSNATVASAIIAIAMLYKAQLHHLPISKAVSLYHAAKCEYEKLLDGTAQDFDTVLAASFLLCLFEVVHYEVVPVLREPSQVFISRLEAWAQRGLPPSPLSSRIIAWYRLLRTTTVRGGGRGVISEAIIRLFPKRDEGIPNLRSPFDQDADAPTHLYEMLSAPIFEFYLQLQMISGDVARLTHYHRSRTTGTDQDDVVQRMAHIRSRLHSLWDGRSATQRQKPEDLRSHLAPSIADPVITLSGICTAAYHAELVEMGRVLGDPLSEVTESKQAMRRIRELVDGDWNAFGGDGKLNPGYLRPLFLYAIECMDREENQWAVERLGQIKDPIGRSDFWASFGKALSDAQLLKKRRVTTSYFCVRYFGVSPPFL